MRIFIECIADKNIVLISADERLDLSAYGTFKEAASIAMNTPDAMIIVVDLGRTKKIFDSGLAMLQELKQMVVAANNRVYLTNVNPDMKQKLTQAGLDTQFHINNGSELQSEYSKQSMFRKAG